MSLSTRLTDAITRIGLEFKSVRSAIAQKYTKPVAGIPLTDLDASVAAQITPQWGNIIGRPAAYPASSHTHTIVQVDGLTDSLNGKVSSFSGGQMILWTGTVANLPSSRNANTIYLAW